jgi:hypothetical protein
MFHVFNVLLWLLSTITCIYRGRKRARRISWPQKVIFFSPLIPGSLKNTQEIHGDRRSEENPLAQSIWDPNPTPVSGRRRHTVLTAIESYWEDWIPSGFVELIKLRYKDAGVIRDHMSQEVGLLGCRFLSNHLYQIDMYIFYLTSKFLATSDDDYRPRSFTKLVDVILLTK